MNVFFRSALLAAILPLANPVATAQEWAVKTLPNPRVGMAATAVGDQVFFAGGNLAGGNTPTAIVDIYNETTGGWSTTMLPAATANGTACTVGTKAYFVAGFGPGFTLSPDIYVYDTTTGMFSTISMSTNRAGSCATVLGTDILLPGGILSQGGGPPTHHQDVEIVTTTNNMTSTVPLNTPFMIGLSEMSATSVGGLTFCTGGRDDSTFFFRSEIYSVDPTSMTGGVIIGNMTESKVGVMAHSVGTRAYFIGGLNNSSLTSATIEVFDTATNMLTSSSLPQPVQSAGSAVLGSEIIIAGGFSTGGVTNDVFFIQDPAGTVTQSVLPNGAAARVIDASAATANAAYFAGGGDGMFMGATFDDVFIYGDLPMLGTETCNGDGGDQMGCTDCPCGNNAPMGTIGGCINSAGTSSRLEISGTGSVAAADLRFEASGVAPMNSCVLTSGNAAAPANAMNPCFGLDSGIQSLSLDGLRCAVQGVLRHGVRPSDANGDVGVTTNGWGNPNGFFQFDAFMAGDSKHFQIIHRDDAAMVCGTGQNTSQSISITFSL